MFAPLATALGPGHRLVALDQRGHGLSDHGGPFTREDYVEDADGWRLLFDYADMMASQEALLGDFWDDWLASSCPALLLHGQESPMLSASMARTMAERRPRTHWTTFPGCGHWIHDDDPAGFAEAVREFLARI